MDITLPYRVFSVDPATTKSGWAMLEVQSLEPLQIKVLRTGQFDGAQLLRNPNHKALAKVFSKQFCVIDALELEYIELLEEFKPDVVVSESAFAHIHVSAALALTLAIHALRRAARFVLNMDVVMVPPTISKLAFTGSGGADKDKMRKSYEIAPWLICDRSQEISEHEIDAVSHGCAHIRRDVIGDVVQISAKDKKKKKLENKKK